MKKCPKCGYENRETAHFCQGCGEALPVSSSPSETGTSRRSTKPLSPASQPDTARISPSSAPLPDTRPLSKASLGFAPLPEGALLRDGRYAVLETHATDDRLNVYLVEDSTLVRLCPNCRAEITDPQEQFCFFCGADLAGVDPLHLHYLMRESTDDRAFAVEAQLLEMHLEHPGLFLPHDFFVEAPYGPPRRYLMESEFLPPLAASLDVPQDLTRVLEWGVSLAQALDYLHRHQVTWCNVEENHLDHVAILGKTAGWVHFGAACVITPEERLKAAGYFARDVQGLAAVLSYLATGRQGAVRRDLPEQVATLFSRAFTAPAGLSAADFAADLISALQKIRRPASVTLVVGYRTDVGQERSLNEDSLLTLDVAPVYRSVSAPVGLYVVADGMGGHEAGDVASRVAVQVIAQQAVGEVFTPAVVGEALPEVREWLVAAAQLANQVVYDQRKAAGTDMGTTLVMALFVGDTATVANVGDSRAYLLKSVDTIHRIQEQGDVIQITTDHSLVERLVATGQITPAEALNHPQKNVIYRVIGDKPQVEVDLFEQQLVPGDALLLCSDGLSGMVSNEQILHIWRTSTSPQEACDRLVEVANQAGGVDNVTVVIVQVVGR